MITSPRSHAAGLVMALGTAVALASAGCDNASTTSGGGAGAAPSYEAQTQGTTAALVRHLKFLTQRFADTEINDISTFRKSLLAYSDAVDATAEAVLARDDASPNQRQQAVDAKFAALARRIEVDPGALDRLLKDADRLEKMPAETGIPPAVASARIGVLSKLPDLEAPDPAEDRRRLERLAEASAHFGKVKPAHPGAPKTIFSVAKLCEQRGRDDLARGLYETLVNEFPDDPAAEFARGSVARMDNLSKPLEDFSGPGLSGGTVDLKAFRGKVVLIDFWATWCEPCMKELQALYAVRKDLGPKGFEIIGVCLDESDVKPKRLLNADALPWPQIYSPPKEGEVARSPLALRFGVSELPYKMLVDREGRFVAGGVSMNDLRDALRKQFPDVVAKPVPPQRPSDG